MSDTVTFFTVYLLELALTLPKPHSFSPIPVSHFQAFSRPKEIGACIFNEVFIVAGFDKFVRICIYNTVLTRFWYGLSI